MSELEQFINTHRLSKPVRHFMKKSDERELRYVFRAYGIEYKYIPYMPSNEKDPRNKNFPPNTDIYACIIEAPFTKEDLYKIIELGETDEKTDKEESKEFKRLVEDAE